MGYVFMTGYCFICGSMFTYNPVRVPVVRDSKGEKQAVCRECIDRANVERVKLGLKPLVPAPDAYQAVREEEL